MQEDSSDAKDKPMNVIDKIILSILKPAAIKKEKIRQGCKWYNYW